MTRINTNISSVIAQQRLSRSGGDLQLRLERLSTGLRINRGKDDPAGLIISERLGTDIKGIEQAIKNGQRASSVIATTEGSLTEINDLLNSIKSLAVEAANTGAISDEERKANQLQIDSAIQSITRISNTASFGGLKLLDGTLDYVTSGITASTIALSDITGASFSNGTSINVDVDVIGSAQMGGLYLNGDTAGTDGALQSQMTIQVKGDRGVREYVFQSGQTYTQIVAAINQDTSITGVTANLINGDETSGMVFQSEEYGSDGFVSVKRLDAPSDNSSTFEVFKYDGDVDFVGNGPPFDWTNTDLVSATRDAGRDVTALVNGILATGEGLNISINSPSLSMSLLLTESYAIDPSLTVSSFDITGGGALFQLGPDISALQQTNIGIQSTSSETLGGIALSSGAVQFLSSLQTGQANSLDSAADQQNFTTLQDIVDKSIDEVSILRGRLGAFERNVLDTNSRSLQAAYENLTASRSTIRDADFAIESSELTRAQILQSSGTTVLGLANQSAQQVLQLLG
jgi:flagellin